MVVEIAEFEVRTGHEDDFVAAFKDALPLAAAIDGFRSARLTRGIESPAIFVALIEWDRVEDHTVTFHNSANFGKWREIVSPHFLGSPRIQHAADI